MKIKFLKRITEDTFIMISNKYEKEQLEIKEKTKRNNRRNRKSK